MIRYETIINKRMETCKACPIYNHAFNSCGTPIIQKALNLFNEPVELDGKKFKPCGCHMPTKSRFTLFDCPAGRWEPIVEKSLKNDLLNIAKMIKQKGNANLEERKNLQAIYNSVMGTKIDITTIGCSQCINNILDNIDMEMRDNIEAEIIEKNSPEESEQILNDEIKEAKPKRKYTKKSKE
ncbi:hypothetical protein UFOVP386_37 [uncultured Caudovirales phage]|uniref:Uncharacterized protein n=1 Tax=uncultured Caudovirales phage TaxID=2100421 RepID=A0A6J7X155_9CAUD|nr:hypothetical protein UFOVP386_37 [uncultured Caudovirales phage]